MRKLTNISGGPPFIGTITGVPGSGQRPRSRGQILQVYGGYRSAVWSWPAKSNRGAEGVIGFWDRIGQDINDTGRGRGLIKDYKPDENIRSTTKVSEHTLARVH